MPAGVRPVQPVQPAFRRKRQTVSLACERCRKRKAKCSGLMPSCQSCIVANAECVYQAPEAGKRLRYRDLESAYNDMCRAAAVRGSDSEEPHFPANEPVRRWLEALRMKKERRHMSVISTVDSPQVLPVSMWTAVSNDDCMLTGLLTLFWTWSPALSSIVSRDLFLDGLCNDTTAGSACSGLLVNAMLALSSACFVAAPDDRWHLHTKFAKEARRLMEAEGPFREPLILRMQGVAILCVYECIFSHDDTSASLLRIFYELRSAIRHGQPFGPTTDLATAFDFLQIQLGLVYPSFSLTRSATSTSGPSDDRRQLGTETTSNDRLWSPYPISDQPRLSFCSELSRAQRELVRLAGEILPAIEANHNCLLPDYKVSKTLYVRLLAWHETHVLEYQGQTSFVPAWVFLNLTYHVIALKLLDPFNWISLVDFDGQKPARPLSQSHGESVVSTLWRYRTAYDMWHDFWLLHACYAAVSSLLLGHSLAGGSSHKEALTQGCQLLCDTSARLPLASRMCHELQRTWRHLSLPGVVRRYLGRGAARSLAGSVIKGTAMVGGDDGGSLLGPCIITFGETIRRIEER